MLKRIVEINFKNDINKRDSFLGENNARLAPNMLLSLSEIDIRFGKMVLRDHGKIRKLASKLTEHIYYVFPLRFLSCLKVKEMQYA